jgi:osmotically-inducible protein OsmY
MRSRQKHHYEYGSTQESRDFRNQSEDRYQSAMDFGSHNYDADQKPRENGGYAGRGPKGYKRSDERIKEDVSDLILRHDEIDGSDLEVEVASGEVTLNGTVPNRRMKRAVEDLIERVLKVPDIHNRLRVQEASPTGANH